MKTDHKPILARIIQLQKHIEEMKAMYTELDMLTMQLQAEGFKDAEFEGLVISLVDNFLSANTCFRPAGVKRFEIKTKKVK